MKPACFAIPLCLVTILGLLSGRCCCEEPAGLMLERALSLPEGEAPRISTGTQRPRTLVFSEKIPTPSGAHAIVVARMDEVWYFDSDDFSVIHKKTFSANELICVSRDGTHIAVYQSIRLRRIRESLRLIRVETWKGDHLWEKSMNLGQCGGFEPTLTGGLIVYPSADMSTDRPPVSDWKTVPPAVSNGLMILDADGELLLEDPVWAHLALDFEGIVSEDGRYLAFAYGWTETERRDASELRLYGDRGCIALYDVAAGVKLWSHCFENVRLGRVALDASAGSIVCFAASLDERITSLHFITLLLFSREGQQLASRSLAEPGQLFSARSPVISPDGRCCGFAVRANHFDELESMKVYAVNTSGGEVEWEFSLPEGFHGLACRAVNDDGCAVVTAKRDSPGGSETHVLFVHGGNVRQDVDLGEFGDGRPISQVFMPGAGQSIWMLQGRILSMYSVNDLCFPQGSEAE